MGKTILGAKEDFKKIWQDLEIEVVQLELGDVITKSDNENDVTTDDESWNGF